MFCRDISSNHFPPIRSSYESRNQATQTITKPHRPAPGLSVIGTALAVLSAVWGLKKCVSPLGIISELYANRPLIFRLFGPKKAKLEQLLEEAAERGRDEGRQDANEGIESRLNHCWHEGHKAGRLLGVLEGRK